MTNFKTAISLLKNRKFADTSEILEDLITRDPRNSDILYNLGMCYTECPVELYGSVLIKGNSFWVLHISYRGTVSPFSEIWFVIQNA